MTTTGGHLLVRGDARRLPLADGSVHCVVTSPPYWGLRDYGTARWEGGDPECDHASPPTGGQTKGSTLIGTGNRNGYSADGQYRSICAKCGARRIDRQIGLEESPDAYVAAMVAVFREVWRVLRDDGSVWLNLGDSFSSGNRNGHGNIASTKQLTNNHAASVVRPSMADGLKPKDLCLIPERVALALQADGWFVRAKPPWIKPSSMPESVTDRPSVAHESIFLLSKRPDYFYDADATRQPHTMRPQRRPNGRPVDGTPRPGQPKQSWSTAARDEVDVDGHPLGRNRRTSDWLTESLDELIAHHEAYAAHLRGIRGRGGILAAEGGDPLAFRVTTYGFEGAHFATFPPRLIQPMVKASTSEAGCCPACGKPWERIVERGELVPDAPNHKARGNAAPANQKGLVKRALHPAGTTQGHPNHHYEYKTLGWQPACRCDAGPPVPPIVFDPFIGSGTTIVVANALGRHGIGCDLSPDYLPMAARRIARPHAPALRLHGEAVLPLFDAMEAGA